MPSSDLIKNNHVQKCYSTNAAGPHTPACTVSCFSTTWFCILHPHPSAPPPPHRTPLSAPPSCHLFTFPACGFHWFSTRSPPPTPYPPPHIPPPHVSPNTPFPRSPRRFTTPVFRFETYRDSTENDFKNVFEKVFYFIFSYSDVRDLCILLFHVIIKQAESRSVKNMIQQKQHDCAKVVRLNLSVYKDCKCNTMLSNVYFYFFWIAILLKFV